MQSHTWTTVLDEKKFILPSFVIQMWLLLYVMCMERSIEHVKFPHENNFQLFCKIFSFQKIAKLSEFICNIQITTFLCKFEYREA